MVSDAPRRRGWLQAQASAVQTIPGSMQRPCCNQAVQDACADVFPQVEQPPRLRHRETEAWHLVELGADSHDESNSLPDIAPIYFGGERDVWNRGGKPSEACWWLTKIHVGCFPSVAPGKWPTRGVKYSGSDGKKTIGAARSCRSGRL